MWLQKNSSTSRKGLDYFLAKASTVHGDKYDYSKVKFGTMDEFVTIICPVHGEFNQRGTEHFAYGCQKCARQYVGDKLRDDIDSFVKKARQKHGDKYDYSLVNIGKPEDKVTIVCPVHGAFSQNRGQHIYVSGCPDCGDDRTAKRLALSTDEFIARARAIHGDRYDYSKVEYKNSKTKVIIICKKHGEFKQIATDHMSKKELGCSKCSESRGERKVREWLESNGVKHVTQKRMKNRMRFDFAISRSGSPLLIEFHGYQHYIPSSFRENSEQARLESLFDNMRRDRKKMLWCRARKIPLYIVPFWDDHRIGDILEAIMMKVDPCISMPPEKVNKYRELRNEFMQKIHDGKAQASRLLFGIDQVVHA